MYIDRRRLLTGALVLVMITALVTFGVTAMVYSHPGFLGLRVPRVHDLIPSPGGAGGYAGLDKVRAVMDELRKSYVDAEKTKEEVLVNGAIEGMVKSLDDPYSVYLDTKKFKDLMSHFSESFSGIGVRVESKDGFVTVVAPIKGTPGEKAGLVAGDKIVEVDGKDVGGMALDEAVRLIRGPKGTQVRLKIIREGQAQPLLFTIIRADIAVPNIESKMIEPGVGYIRLIEFNEKAGQRVRAEVNNLRKQGMKGLIFDLRQDPGGLLSEAVSVAEVFVPAGPVVHVVSREGDKKTYESNSRGFNLPLVVLIDGFSASASEIVAGAVQDRAAGTLVGTKTFGKGSVQNLITLKDGAGLKLTTAKYLTPNGRSIHGSGIVPDVVIEMPKGGKPHGVALDDPNNSQLIKAIEVIKSKF